MQFTKTTRAVLLSAVVAAATATLPTMGVAEGHTSEYAGNKGFVGDKGFVGKVKHRTHRHTYRRHQKKRTHAQAAATSSCPHNFYGMYLGTMYCQAGVIVK